LVILVFIISAGESSQLDIDLHCAMSEALGHSVAENFQLSQYQCSGTQFLPWHWLPNGIGH
jgi:hypothetical protein